MPIDPHLAGTLDKELVGLPPTLIYLVARRSLNSSLAVSRSGVNLASIFSLGKGRLQIGAFPFRFPPPFVGRVRVGDRLPRNCLRGCMTETLPGIAIERDCQFLRKTHLRLCFFV